MKYNGRVRREPEVQGMAANYRAAVGAIVCFGLGLSAWLTFLPGRSDAG